MCKCEAETKQQDIVPRLNSAIFAGAENAELLQEAVKEINRRRQQAWMAEGRAVAAERKLAAVRAALC